MAERLLLYMMLVAIAATGVLALGGSGGLVVGAPVLAWAGLAAWLG